MLRDNGNVTFRRRHAQKPYPPTPDFAENDMSMRHATIRWRYAGLPSARVL
jgi:hypothetical protein